MQKTVFITGVSRGIGLATAKEFVSRDCDVIGTSTTGKPGFTSSKQLVFKLDLSVPKSIAKLVSEISNRNIRFDFMINNAGIMVDQSEELVNIVKLRDTLEVNLVGTINLTENLIKRINDGGCVVNISSELGSLVQNMPNKAYAYRISKTALNMYTRILSQRLAPRNIRVYSFAPGWVKTDLGTQNATREPEEPAKEIYALCLSQCQSGLFYEQNRVRDW